jgi:hypothetical protein
MIVGGFALRCVAPGDYVANAKGLAAKQLAAQFCSCAAKGHGEAVGPTPGRCAASRPRQGHSIGPDVCPTPGLATMPFAAELQNFAAKGKGRFAWAGCIAARPLRKAQNHCNTAAPRFAVACSLSYISFRIT